MFGRPSFWLAAGCACCGAPAAAELSAYGSVRARYEALTGQFRPGFDDRDDMVSFRTILGAEYDAGPVRVGAELRDGRVYDADPGSPVSANEVNVLEPVQAYIGADLDDALGAGSATTVDVGRFTMDLGSRRLVADDNFRNTTNGFTGIRLDWRGKGGAAARIFYTLPQIRLPGDKASVLDNDVELDEESFDLTFWGGIVTLPKVVAGASLDLYFYALDEDDSADTATRNRKLFTPGLRLFREPKAGAWDFELEAVYQVGDIRAGTSATAPRQDVSAGFVRAAVGHSFAALWKPRLSLEFDYASGDRAGGSYNRFDTLYGSRTADFGPSGIYGPYGRANIVAPALRLQLVPNARWDGFLHYRPAWLDAKEDSFSSTGVRDSSGRSGSFAGHQAELRARYWIVPKRLRLETGGAVLLRGRFLKDAPNATGNGDTVYGYSALELTF